MKKLLHSSVRTPAFTAGALLALLAVTGGAAAAQDAPPAADGRIAFVTDDGMASINPDGSGPWGLRFTRIGQSAPAWSPDGSAIAFTETGHEGIFVMDPDGTSIQPLVQRHGASNAAWSPDGRRIAFDDGEHVFTADIDGGAVLRIVVGSWPTWSPDGERIAYFADGDIHAIELETRAVTRLTSSLAYDAQPAWSPDGASIMFVSNRDVGPALYVMKPDGTGQTRVSVGHLADAQPSWSPQGSRIVFVRNGQVWVSDRDGSDARQLVHGNAWSLRPAWQPLPDTPDGCTLGGTDANDLLVGSDHSDVICGGDGDDSVIGLGGPDVLRGGAGSDWIAGGLDGDIVEGGPGDDRIDVRDGAADRGDAGPGHDAVVVDSRARDNLRSSERTTASTNVAAWRPTTASAEEATNPSVLAVDGRIDDYWSSGGYPMQWIEINLQRPTTVSRLRLIAPDLPAGVPVLVLGRSASPTSPYRLLHRFRGPTVFKQELRFRPRNPWRRVQLVRLQVPVSASMGWVSWPEIEVHASAP